MNVLLLSMPDSFEHMPPVAIRMPNGALTSLAGNVDPHHRVAAADLLLVQDRVRETVERLLADHEPDIVGLSVMTFQRKTAKGIIDLVRTLRPRAHVVVGGYDPSLAPEAYTEDPDGGVDFIVRGEGEITFRELLRALEAQRGYDHIAGLSYRSADGFRHNPARPRERARGRRDPAAAARRASARRLHAPRPASRRDRDLARLHLRLQLLLDYRDARTQLPRLLLRAGLGGHPRRAGPWRPVALHRGRQHHSKRAAVRGALPGDYRRRTERSRVHRSGDDLGHLQPRRAARPADARGRLPLRLPRHREHPRRGFAVPQSRIQEPRAR